MRWRWIGLIVIMCIGIATYVYGQQNQLAYYNNTAIAEAQSDNWRSALNNYHRAQVLMPDEPLPYFNLATLLINRNEWTLAEQALLQALASDDQDLIAKAYYNLGNLYYETDEYTKSIWAYQQALLRNPQAENARYNLELALRSGIQPTPAPETPQNEDQPLDTNGDLPSDMEDMGSIIEIDPIPEAVGVMSLEDAEALLDQIQREQQALIGALPPSDNTATPERDW